MSFFIEQSPLFTLAAFCLPSRRCAYAFTTNGQAQQEQGRRSILTSTVYAIIPSLAISERTQGVIFQLKAPLLQKAIFPALYTRNRATQADEILYLLSLFLSCNFHAKLNSKRGKDFFPVLQQPVELLFCSRLFSWKSCSKNETERCNSATLPAYSVSNLKQAASHAGP